MKKSFLLAPVAMFIIGCGDYSSAIIFGNKKVQQRQIIAAPDASDEAYAREFTDLNIDPVLIAQICEPNEGITCFLGADGSPIMRFNGGIYDVMNNVFTKEVTLENAQSDQFKQSDISVINRFTDFKDAYVSDLKFDESNAVFKLHLYLDDGEMDSRVDVINADYIVVSTSRTEGGLFYGTEPVVDMSFHSFKHLAELVALVK